MVEAGAIGATGMRGRRVQNGTASGASTSMPFAGLRHHRAKLTGVNVVAPPRQPSTCMGRPSS
jgi:hypothetical protein